MYSKLYEIFHWTVLDSVQRVSITIKAKMAEAYINTR